MGIVYSQRWAFIYNRTGRYMVISPILLTTVWHILSLWINRLLFATVTLVKFKSFLFSTSERRGIFPGKTFKQPWEWLFLFSPFSYRQSGVSRFGSQSVNGFASSYRRLFWATLVRWNAPYVGIRITSGVADTGKIFRARVRTNRQITGSRRRFPIGARFKTRIV